MKNRKFGVYKGVLRKKQRGLIKFDVEAARGCRGLDGGTSAVWTAPTNKRLIGEGDLGPVELQSLVRQMTMSLNFTDFATDW